MTKRERVAKQILDRAPQQDSDPRPIYPGDSPREIGLAIFADAVHAARTLYGIADEDMEAAIKGDK